MGGAMAAVTGEGLIDVIPDFAVKNTGRIQIDVKIYAQIITQISIGPLRFPAL